MPRPSGHPIIEDITAPVTMAVAVVEKRGRINILPRWRKRVAWLADLNVDVEALMVFSEPGLISIRCWQPAGPRIEERFAELASSTDADAQEALRLIQDRYQRLIIPCGDRSSLGDGALAHLGLSLDRRTKSVLYVSVSSDRIDLMSSTYRDAKLIEGHTLIEDLP
jgi:hypothetical protein